MNNNWVAETLSMNYYYEQEWGGSKRSCEGLKSAKFAHKKCSWMHWCREVILDFFGD